MFLKIKHFAGIREVIHKIIHSNCEELDKAAGLSCGALMQPALLRTPNQKRIDAYRLSCYPS
jgi:hypothetical protein